MPFKPKTLVTTTLPIAVKQIQSIRRNLSKDSFMDEEDILLIEHIYLNLLKLQEKYPITLE